MASYSAFRLFFRLEKPGRLPTFGNVGITCTTPFLERQHLALQARQEDAKRTSMQGISCTASRFKIPAFRYTILQLKCVHDTLLVTNAFCISCCRSYSTAVSTGDVTKSDAARLGPKKKGKTAESPRIILISETKHISAVTLEEAHKIAEKKGLHLVPSDSHLSQDKPSYKLVTNVEFLESSETELDSASAKGSIKIIY